MGAAHEAIANNANTDRFFAHLCDRLEKEAEGARLNVGQCSDALFFVFEGILIEERVDDHGPGELFVFVLFE